MSRLTMHLAGIVIAAAILGGCASAPIESSGPNAPKVELERVDVAAYFGYAAPPGRLPLVLAFVFNVTNPTGRTITLDELKFSYSFEAKPGEFFALNTPTVYDTMHIPAGATNQVRVVSVLDSAIVPATLAVTSGFRLQALDLKGPDVVKMWWEKIGDFEYRIKVSEGTAMFSGPGGNAIVVFEGIFPKK
ncbi:MAG: hypothetical protein AABZ48_00495 [candidate division NC10 bacterium]